jgi:hypothetical protein
MPTDLVLLVADKNIEHGLRGLLSRPQALGIRSVTSRTYVHPQRDPGCAQKSHEFLRQFSADYDRALVVFDHHGCGRENRVPTQLEHDVRDLLWANGWDGRAQAIVIEPELEAWVFATSPLVERCLAWPGAEPLRQWLQNKGLWSQGREKPADPKAALETVLAVGHARLRFTKIWPGPSISPDVKTKRSFALKPSCNSGFPRRPPRSRPEGDISHQTSGSRDYERAVPKNQAEKAQAGTARRLKVGRAGRPRSFTPRALCSLWSGPRRG